MMLLCAGLLIMIVSTESFLHIYSKLKVVKLITMSIL